MKHSQIFFKTMKFIWLKLALGLATFVASVLLLMLCLGLSSLFGGGAIGILLLVWLGLTVGLNSVLNRYFGYMLKAGHIAVVAHAVSTGQLPEDQIAFAKEMVKSRFLTANAFFVVDRLVAGSIKQLQKGLDRVGGLLAMVPGLKGLTSLLKLFVDMSLKYVDECCLGYMFLKKEENAFKSAADGVVIYFQNWKRLLKNAAVMSGIVVLFTVASYVVAYAVLGIIAALFGGAGVFTAFLALVLAVILKNAFLDSYLMVKMMTKYLQVAGETQIGFDLYGKLCGLSRKFRELFEKGGQPAEPVAPLPTVGA